MKLVLRARPFSCVLGRAPACPPRPSERAARPCAFERASEERTGGTRQAGRKRTAAMRARRMTLGLSLELLVLRHGSMCATLTLVLTSLPSS